MKFPGRDKCAGSRRYVLLFSGVDGTLRMTVSMRPYGFYFDEYERARMDLPHETT